MSNRVPQASAQVLLPLDEVISLLQLPFLPVTRPNMLVLLASSSVSPPASVIYQDRLCLPDPRDWWNRALGQGLMSHLEGKIKDQAKCPLSITSLIPTTLLGDRCRPHRTQKLTHRAPEPHRSGVPAPWNSVCWVPRVPLHGTGILQLCHVGASVRMLVNEEAAGFPGLKAVFSAFTPCWLYMSRLCPCVCHSTE